MTCLASGQMQKENQGVRQKHNYSRCRFGCSCRLWKLAYREALQWERGETVKHLLQTEPSILCADSSFIVRQCLKTNTCSLDNKMGDVCKCGHFPYKFSISYRKPFPTFWPGGSSFRDTPPFSFTAGLIAPINLNMAQISSFILSAM